MDCHNKCDIGNMYKFQEDLGYDLRWLGDLLNPLGCALGIWIVGNIGRYGCVVISSYMLLQYVPVVHSPLQVHSKFLILVPYRIRNRSCPKPFKIRHFFQRCGSKYIEFGFGSGSRSLAQCGSGSGS